MENKQTAVEWFYSQIPKTYWDYNVFEECNRIFQEAKAMEKEQIIKTWNDGDYAYFSSKETGKDFDDGEQYYNEVYGK